MAVRQIEIARLGLAVGEMVAPEAAAASERFVAESLAAMFKQPQKLPEVLPKLGRFLAQIGGEGCEESAALFGQPIAKNNPLVNVKVTRFLGSGESNFVLATEGNTALKIGPQGVIRPITNTDFEAPVLSHGELSNGLNYYEQPLGVTKGVTNRHVSEVIGKMRANGYVEQDLWDYGRGRTEQVALFGPKRTPLLIDQGSAVPGYGTIYSDGSLIAHPQQASNLGAIREFLAERQISLIPRSSVKPVNPLLGGENTFSKTMSDRMLTDALSDHLSIISSAKPTAARYWTQAELEHALSTMAQSGK